MKGAHLLWSQSLQAAPGLRLIMQIPSLSITIFLLYISQNVRLACRVEMTVSRGVLRIAGTIVGGTIGYLIMYYHGLAANPFALMASPDPILIAT